MTKNKIDWTKPVETVDGTLVRVESRSYGTVNIVRNDGENFTFAQSGGLTGRKRLCVCGKTTAPWTTSPCDSATS